MTVMSRYRPGPVTRRILRAPSLLYRWHAGWLLGRRFLLLTHVGRRSGRRYQTVLEVLGTRPESNEIVVLAALGRSAQWYRNLRANGSVEVAMGARRFRAAYRELDEPEAAAVLADYERRNRWATPVVRRVLSRLVGWTYDGSDEARHRLVRELPLVALSALTSKAPPRPNP
jgi:deazaflavin-dependent oxidoreductase (nitroreductase family)